MLSALTIIFISASLGGGAEAETSDSVAENSEFSPSSENSSTKALPGGTFETEVFAVPINYETADGKWAPIESEWVDSEDPGYAVDNKTNSVEVALPANLGEDPVHVADDDDWLNFSLRDGNGAPTSSSDTATYEEAVPGVSLTYELTGEALKETLTLEDPNSPSTFAFDLDYSAGLEVVPTKDGGVDFLNESGEAAFAILPPVAWDASGPENSLTDRVSMELVESDEGDVLSLSVDEEWLAAKERLWPVVVDPTITYPSVSQDCHIVGGAGSSNQNFCYAPYPSPSPRLQVGYDGNRTGRALLKFDVAAAVPANATVERATLELFMEATDGISDLSLNVHRLNKSWTTDATWLRRTSTQDWLSAGGEFDPIPSDLAAVTALSLGSKQWEVAPLVEEWLDGSVTNNGMMIKQSPTTEGFWRTATFRSSDYNLGTHPQDYWPRLRIEYTPIDSGGDPFPGDGQPDPNEPPARVGTIDPVMLPHTPSNELLVVTANVIQASADGAQAPCTTSSGKLCDPVAREDNFAARIKKLGGKALGAEPDLDGMAYAPDVIVLQEVRCGDVNSIIGELKEKIIRPEDGLSANYKMAKCFESPQNDTVVSRSSDHTVRADTAIVYDYHEVRRVGKGTYAVTKYDDTDRPQACRDNPNLFLDTDGDLINDCERTYKRHFIQKFKEVTSGTQFAIASVRFVAPGHLNEDTDPVTGETTHERLATTWVKAVADKIKNAYPSVGGYFIAGDFNIKKCAINVAPPPSMPRESTTCAPRSWWTTLTTPSYSYSDTEWARNSTTQSQFDAQFRDGCIEFDSPTSDMCSTDGLRHFREKRIDFVFSASGNKVVNPVDASHDLTCGIKRGNYAPHCDDHGNPQYYSDHRLTWTYVAMS